MEPSAKWRDSLKEASQIWLEQNEKYDSDGKKAERSCEWLYAVTKHSFYVTL